MKKERTANIVFAKGGVETLIELSVAFSRACFSTSHIFCNLVSWKKHSLRLVEIELSVKFSPPFANTFSVMHNATSDRQTIQPTNKIDKSYQKN